MKIKIMLSLTVLGMMFVVITITQAANNATVVDDFEGYTASQLLDGQGGWVATNPCNITVENVSGNNILRSGNCVNGQAARKNHSFPFTNQIVYSYVQFKGRITSGAGNNSSSLVSLISPNESIDFGMGNNPSLGINHQLRFSSPTSGPIYGPSLTPGTWYDFRLEIDWTYTSLSGRFGIGTLKYKPSTSSNWLSNPALSNLELNVVDPTQFNEVMIRMDGISNRRGEMDEIHYLIGMPEIGVQGNGQSISNGDNTPSVIDDTDFGVTTVGTPIMKTYTISNSGSITLTLMAPITVPNGFSAGNFGTIQVPSNGTTTVDIQLNATTSGTFSGFLQITNNDSDETPFAFVINGIVNDPAPSPDTGSGDNEEEEDGNDDDDNNASTSAPHLPVNQVFDCWPWLVIVSSLSVPNASNSCLPSLGEPLPVPSTFRYLGHSTEVTINDAADMPLTQFNPSLKVCFRYTQAELNAIGGDPNRFLIQTFREGKWESLPTTPEDDPSAAILGRVCVSVNHLTLFALFAESEESSFISGVKYLPETGNRSGIIWSPLMGKFFLGIVVVILIEIVLVYGLYKKVSRSNWDRGIQGKDHRI